MAATENEGVLLGEGCSARCKALCLWKVAAEQKKPVISDLRLAAPRTEHRLRSNPPQPPLCPPRNVVLAKPRAGHRQTGSFSPAASAAETVPTVGYLGGARPTATHNEGNNVSTACYSPSPTNTLLTFGGTPACLWPPNLRLGLPHGCTLSHHLPARKAAQKMLKNTPGFHSII